MIHIGITGQSGFIGTHLFHRIQQSTDHLTCIPFFSRFFKKPQSLEKFVNQCDVIIHLAAVIRHPNETFLYQENIGLTNNLIDALKKSSKKTHLIYVSSIKESEDSAYGQSHRDSMKKLQDFCQQENHLFHGIIVPNVFGPLSKPHHNSFIATFSHLIQHNQEVEIIEDSEVPLLYIDHLCQQLFKLIQQRPADKIQYIQPDLRIKVSAVLEHLKYFHLTYTSKGEIPSFQDSFQRHLFLTYLSFIDLKLHFPRPLDLKSTQGSIFAEVIKTNISGQTSYSVIEPGVTRGNHYHTRKFERFTILRGKAEVSLRKVNSESILHFQLDGSQPSYIDIPPWHIHSVKNIGSENTYMLYWINEFYNESNSDTYISDVLN